TLTYSAGNAGNAAVGTYTNAITPSAATGGTFTASNYLITYVQGNVVVGKATLTATPANQSRPYGSANPAFPINYTGFVNGETIAVINTAPTAATTATTASNAGTYNITASGGVDDNYTFNYVNGTLTVTQVTLTVKADNQTKIQGAANPTLTFVITGFVNGDTQAVINTLPTASTTATTGSAVGTYPITVAGGADNNYTFSYVPATLTVNPQAPAFTYITPQSISVGTTVSLSPTSTGGAVANYSVSPALPAGLSINAGTGIISGTPTTVTATTTYTITGTNVTGNNTAPDVITITATGSNAFDWSGATSTAWNIPGNWQVNGVTQTTIYPGSVSTTDVVRVGVNTAIPTFSNQPTLSTANITIASLTFGNNNAAVNNNTGGVINLTVNGFTLAVTGAITQNHSTTGGNSFGFATDVGVTTTLQGTGSITCASVTVGDNVTLPSNNPEVTVTKLQIGSTTASTLNVTITNDLTINSASNAGGLIFQNSNAYVSLAAGTLTIGGTIREVTGTPSDVYFIGTFAPSAQFSIDLNNTNTPVLNLSGATPINIGTNNNNSTNNQVDFYNPTVTPHKASTVNYTGASQRVYNYNTSTTMNTQFDNNGEANGDGYVYQNIGFSGSGTKTVDAGTLKVNGNFAIAAGTETVTLATNNPTLTVNGDYSTGAGSTFNNGTNPVTFNGNFTNAGTSNFGTPLVTFNNANINPLVITTSTAQAFTNLLFSGTGAGVTLIKQTGSGAFTVASTGVMGMSGTAHVNVTNATFTLLSDANGSATVSNIPSTCIFNGNVSVQRYIQAHRAYRLISSPVYSASVTSGANTFNDYSLNYVKLTSFLTGTTGVAGGFDQGVNPTLYLYRENLAPLFTTFLNSNYRGINNILSAPSYTMDADGGPFNIPVGNGFLFFYRGDRSVASQATETTPSYLATDGTLTATGTLNIGNVAVTDWYTPGAVGLGYTTASGSANVEGSNLVGNPYASSIDWDQYTTGGITHTNVGPFAYRLIPTGAQGSGNYDVYQSNTNVGGNKQGTQGTPNSNIIVSGEGFFVFATNTGALLTFTEAAKTNTQVTGSSLYMAKRVPQLTSTEQYLHIKLSKDTINSDGTIIRFNNNAQANYSAAEDAAYRVGTGKVSLSSLSADRRNLAINQLPFVIKGQKIPLQVTAAADGTYSLSMTGITGIPQLFNVWLKDNLLKDSVDMRQTSSYSFSMLHSDTNSYGSNRFLVVINQNPDYAYRLLSFNATKVPTERAVNVGWTTKYEDNYTSFVVERSVDNGKTFNTLGSIGSVNLGSYSLLDTRPIVGQNLYRLKQVDINNNTTYSKVVQISYSDISNSIAKNNVSLFPNPASSNINLAVLTDISNLTYDVKITNSAGFVVKSATTNQPSLQLNVSNWLPGTYLVKVFNSKDQSEIGTTKFIKL
ncbi:MAG: MBG domain-containing protein, partial [Sphingobacteriales bacterium]